MAIFSYGKVNGLLTKQDLKRAASHVRSSTHALCSCLIHLLPMEGYSSRLPHKKRPASRFSCYAVLCPRALATQFVYSDQAKVIFKY